ncbi:MAG: hypothetical protein ABI537_01235 [Casimicrobiaceae bacterium]
MAILDPSQTQIDPISGFPAMKEILSIAGPTPDPDFPGGVMPRCQALSRSACPKRFADWVRATVPRNTTAFRRVSCTVLPY